MSHCPIDGSALVDTVDDPLVGHHVDRYRVLERIGMGATGCVYRVRHTVLDRERAMKILYGDLGQDARLVERFKREAKAVAKMRHPNVLSVSDFGRSENGLIFLVMELLAGPTLHDEMACYAPFPPARVSEIVEQVAAGLGEAHRLGYVHRDVKPTNIVLAAQDGKETIKILDFGIVGLRSEPLGARLTNLGFLVGTPAYMAPEQATAPSEVTPAADLYSLGVIAYEMLTGRLPFKANDPIDMIVEHSITPPPKLPSCGGLERLVDRMLQKRADDRPQSAQAVIEALSQLELDPFEPVDTSPGLAPPDFELEFLDPITYVAGEAPIATYEALRARLDNIREMLLVTAWESRVRTTFEDRLSELSAAVRSGLRDFRYQDLAKKIGGLEDELRSRMRLRSR